VFEQRLIVSPQRLLHVALGGKITTELTMTNTVKPVAACQRDVDLDSPNSNKFPALSLSKAPLLSVRGGGAIRTEKKDWLVKFLKYVGHKGMLQLNTSSVRAKR
jgi:hypothetical protein